MSDLKKLCEFFDNINSEFDKREINPEYNTKNINNQEIQVLVTGVGLESYTSASDNYNKKLNK